MVRIVLFDDLLLYCFGMRNALEKIPDIVVAGEANSEADLFEILDKTPVQIVLVGVNMPDYTGCVHIVKRLKSSYPHIKIISVADEDNAVALQSMAEVGIDGYIGKREATGHALAHMVLQVANI